MDPASGPTAVPGFLCGAWPHRDTAGRRTGGRRARRARRAAGTARRRCQQVAAGTVGTRRPHRRERAALFGAHRRRRQLGRPGGRGRPRTRRDLCPARSCTGHRSSPPQPALAATIRMLAHNPGSFYTGEFAERAVAALQAGGAPFSGDEWAAGAQVTPSLPSPDATPVLCCTRPHCRHPDGWCCNRRRCATVPSARRSGCRRPRSIGWRGPPGCHSRTDLRCAAAITAVTAPSTS